jgi:hypothetical protein
MHTKGSELNCCLPLISATLWALTVRMLEAEQIAMNSMGKLVVLALAAHMVETLALALALASELVGLVLVDASEWMQVVCIHVVQLGHEWVVLVDTMNDIVVVYECVVDHDVHVHRDRQRQCWTEEEHLTNEYEQYMT